MATPPTRSYIVFALTIAALAGGGAYWVATSPRRVAANQDDLGVEEAALNFGEVWEQNGFKWTLPIHNRGHEDVSIQGFDASCNCLAIEPKTLVIRAGETTHVRLTINLMKRLPEETANVRAFKVMVSPRREGGASRPLVWALSGRVRSAAILSPSSLQFGDLTRGQPFKAQTIIVTPRTPLAHVEAECDPALATVRVKRAMGSEDKFELEVSPKQTAPAGALKFEVRVYPVVESGKRLPPLGVPVEGMVLEDVQAAPGTVAFGAIPIGQVAKEVLVLRSVAGAPFKVQQVEVSAGGIRVEPVDRIATVPGRTFQIIQKVTRPGPQSGKVTFTILQDGKIGRLIVPVSYHGVAAQIR